MAILCPLWYQLLKTFRAAGQHRPERAENKSDAPLNPNNWFSPTQPVTTTWMVRLHRCCGRGEWLIGCVPPHPLESIRSRSRLRQDTMITLWSLRVPSMTIACALTLNNVWFPRSAAEISSSWTTRPVTRSPTYMTILKPQVHNCCICPLFARLQPHRDDIRLI